MKSTITSRPAAEILKAISAKDFLTFGLDQIAYIKPVAVADGEQAWSIHAADGRPLSVLGSVEEAVALSWQNDLRPVQLH